MTEGGRFEEILERLLTVFERAGVGHALIGGLAVAVWGAPRATEDIDLLADLTGSPDLEAALRQAGFVPEWRLLRLRGPAGGPEADVVGATRRWEREMLERAVRVRIPGGRQVPVVSVLDLVVLKLLAGGPGDLADVADLLARSGPLPDLEARAAARGVSDLLRQVRDSLGGG